MSGTYHQLEMQKEEAQKRLDEFGDTATKLNLSKGEYDEKITKEEETIRDLQVSKKLMSCALTLLDSEFGC